MRLCGAYPVPILKMKQKRHWKDREGCIWIKNAADSRAEKGTPGPWAEREKKKTDRVLKNRECGKIWLIV